jgi:DNA invertase Pin-like site-specific DNA recombinase
MATQTLSLHETRTKPEIRQADGLKKRVILYARCSTADQHLETQLLDLREMAKQRGYAIAAEYTDTISGAKSKRPGLDRLLADARRHRFDVVFVAAFDRVARSVRHFLEVLDELNHLGIEFVSFRENIDTGGPLGRAMVVIVGAIAELERSLIVERVKAGMRRARLEGRQIGRSPLNEESTFGRSPDRSGSPENRQRPSRVRPSCRHVADTGREETPDFQGECLPADERLHDSTSGPQNGTFPGDNRLSLTGIGKPVADYQELLIA